MWTRRNLHGQNEVSSNAKPKKVLSLSRCVAMDMRSAPKKCKKNGIAVDLDLSNSEDEEDDAREVFHIK